MINFATEKRGNIHGKAWILPRLSVFFPVALISSNSDDPLIAWQERRAYVAIATDLPRMKKLQPQYLQRYDVAISTARRRKVPRKAVDIATIPVFFPRQAVDIATVLVVLKKKNMVISVRLSAISV